MIEATLVTALVVAIGACVRLWRLLKAYRAETQRLSVSNRKLHREVFSARQEALRFRMLSGVKQQALDVLTDGVLEARSKLSGVNGESEG